MKKIGLIALTILLALSVCACSRKDTTAPTTPQEATQKPTVAPTTAPATDPTLDTNIPDPTVNSNSQGMDFGADDTNPSGAPENSDIGTDNSMNGLDNAGKSRMFRK